MFPKRFTNRVTEPGGTENDFVCTNGEDRAQIVELGGAAAVVAGVILSVHHYAIGACFVAGIAALAVGYKLRQS